MVMTIREHLAIETEGERSPYQERYAEIGARLNAATYRRDREDRRLLRLTKLQRISDARHRAACEDIAEALAELRGMKS